MIEIRLYKLFVLVMVMGFLLSYNCAVNAEPAKDDERIEESSEQEKSEPKKQEEPKYVKNVVWIMLEGVSSFREMPSAVQNIGNQGIQREVFINPNRTSMETYLSLFQGSDSLKLDRNKRSILELYTQKHKAISYTGSIVSGDEFKLRVVSEASKEVGTLKEMYSGTDAFLHIFKIDQGMNRSEINKEFSEMIGYIYNEGLYDYTLFVIHGLPVADKEIETQTFPLIIKGPNTIGSAKLPLVHMSDLAPTVYYLTDGTELKEIDGFVQWDILKTNTRYGDISFLKKRIEELSKRQGELYRTLAVWEKEQKEVQKDKATILEEKASLAKIISERDNEIKQLRLKQERILLGFSGVCIALGLGYFVQYRLLKKRYLLF